MKQKRIIPDPLLMLLSILGITVFMFYWLKESYDREEKALNIKTSAAFEQTVKQLQISKLKLNNVSQDSFPGPALQIKR